MPPIENWKARVGFTPGSSPLYKTWRDGVKQQMMLLDITGKSDSGREKWAKLTQWALKKRPLCLKPRRHGRVEWKKAVDGLLTDVGRKLTHTLRQRVDLDAPPTPVPARLGKPYLIYHLLGKLILKKKW